MQQWDQKPSWRKGAEGCSLLPSHVKCLCLESERKTFLLFPLPRQLSSALSHFCGREGKGNWRWGSTSELLYLYCSSFSLLLLCPATLEVQCPTATVRFWSPSNHWRNWGRIQGVLSCHQEPRASSQPQLCPQPQPPHQLSCHWDSGTNRISSGEVQNQKGIWTNKGFGSLF